MRTKLFQLAVVGILSASSASAQSICAAPASDPFFTISKCPRAWEIGWNGDFSDLAQYSKAETLLYIQGFVDAVHGPTAAFYLSPEMLIARDPHLPHRIGLKTISDKSVMEDVVSDSLKIFGGMLGMLVEERKRQTNTGEYDPFAEIAAIGQGITATHGSPILWASRYGEHDFHAFSAISHSDPETAIGIYRGLAEIVGKL